MCASRPGDARLLGIGCGGRAAVLIQWPQPQAYCLRICRITWILAGTISSCSETTAPISAKDAPSWGQYRAASGSSWITSTRA